MFTTINNLILDSAIPSLEFIGFDTINKNGYITVCLEDQGVFIYNNVMKRHTPAHYVLKLTNGVSYNKTVFVMLKDRGLEESNQFMECGNSYFEMVPHPYIE